MFRRTAFVVSLILVATAVTAATGASASPAARCVGTAPSDFNGDGVSDVAAVEFSGRGLGGGRLHVVYGTRHGLTANAAGTAPDDRLVAAGPGSGNTWGESVAAGDFNGDGCADLAVGDSQATVAGQPDAGRVVIWWGGPARGLHGRPTVVTTAATGAAPAGGDEFGRAVAAADVTGDGADDLIVGAPTGQLARGALYVVPGRALDGGRRYTQGDGTVPGVAGPAHQFGYALATGDVNGDGIPDVAVGAPGVHGGAGGVFVLPGAGNATMLGAGDLWWPGLGGPLPPSGADRPRHTDRAGVAVALGDFNGDGYDDLATGIPAKRVGGHVHAGMVDVLYSAGPTGLTATGSQSWTQDSPGVPDRAERGDDFGAALAAGDFRGEGRDSLAIGVPHESFGGVRSAGVVQILAGGPAGLTAVGGQRWSEASTGIAGRPRPGEGFGAALVTLRVESKKRDDLLVDVEGRDVAGVASAGGFHLIPGSPAGLSARHAQAFTAATPGIKGNPCPACGLGVVFGTPAG